jgi:hypothetical protein
MTGTAVQTSKMSANIFQSILCYLPSGGVDCRYRPCPIVSLTLALRQNVLNSQDMAKQDEYQRKS